MANGLDCEAANLVLIWLCDDAADGGLDNEAVLREGRHWDIEFDHRDEVLHVDVYPDSAGIRKSPLRISSAAILVLA